MPVCLHRGCRKPIQASSLNAEHLVLLWSSKDTLKIHAQYMHSTLIVLRFYKALAKLSLGTLGAGVKLSQASRL